MAKRSRKRRRHLNRQTLISMITVSCVVLAMLLVVTIKSIELREKNESYDQELVALNQQIKEEEDRTDEIEKYSAYIDSDEYIEQIARERLGLIGKDEILFQSEE